MNRKMLLQAIFLYLWPSIFNESAQAIAAVTSYNCASISFPFPFAVGTDCYLDNRVEIDCITDESLTKSINLEVFEFSLGRGKKYGGVKFCQNTIPSSSLSVFTTSIREITDKKDYSRQQECKYVLFDKKIWFETDLKIVPQGVDDQSMISVPDTLDWKIYNGSTFSWLASPDFATFEVDCFSSIEGKSSNFGLTTEDDDDVYIVDSNIIHLIVLVLGGFFVFTRRRRLFNITMKLIQKLFKKNNHGLLLQQILNSNYGERCKLFNSKDIEKATDQFNVRRIVGHGGQGTVYKGMLEDGTVIAVKKSQVADKLEEFINEVVIVSKLEHKNVVKLLGCCLETKVSLLVYEFIPNGNLFEYLHDRNEEFPFTWDIRLRIAMEIAKALCYLHSSSVYHRDIKSTNILLDEMYRAKIADFGISKSIAMDQTHVTTTNVQGTHGYLDPEYAQTSQYSDKSDVYSFGVILAELLTGEKPIFQINSEEYGSLAKYFSLAMRRNHLDDILDDQVRQKVGKKEEIVAFAKITQRCLNIKGTERPTMREVVMTFEKIFEASKKKTLLRKIMKPFNMSETKVE